MHSCSLLDLHPTHLFLLGISIPHTLFLAVSRPTIFESAHPLSIIIIFFLQRGPEFSDSFSFTILFSLKNFWNLSDATLTTCCTPSAIIRWTANPNGLYRIFHFTATRVFNSSRVNRRGVTHPWPTPLHLRVKTFGLASSYPSPWPFFRI